MTGYEIRITKYYRSNKTFNETPSKLANILWNYNCKDFIMNINKIGKSLLYSC